MSSPEVCEARTLRRGQPAWPVQLDEPRPLGIRRLRVRGLDLPDKDRAIAIVGTRRPTTAGVEAAERFATVLAGAGFAIVSGLALGIDAVAHRAALNVGGHTIAVLGCGLAHHYPARNSGLRRLIEARGTVVSQYEDDTGPYKTNFPDRNRVIAALGRAVLVIEGGPRSGSLITARHALDADRDVYALPGSVRNAMAAGPNLLIREGNAALVTDPQQILEEIAPTLVWEGRGETPSSVPDLTFEEWELLERLDDAPASPSDLAASARVPHGRVALTLARLEARGLCVRNGTGYEVSRHGARVRTARLTP